MMRGTNHFCSMAYAIRYYTNEGFEPRDILRKHLTHEFEIGMPEHKATETVCLDECGRYHIQDKQS